MPIHYWDAIEISTKIMEIVPELGSLVIFEDISL